MQIFTIRNFHINVTVIIKVTEFNPNSFKNNKIFRFK